ncbi:MAG: TlpA family protein disulfide reductase [candidate division WOR-3 bacterium]|nr:TlpA family protein disulfide reductase [candidate division WOR-3 bacterium]MDW7987771.1 TlpA disulfide reductase family protein [candidate division WOR-3 bacterium]
MRKFIAINLLLITFIYADSSSLKIAPAFSLYDIKGNVIVLDSLVKKGPVVMSFWALWCKMCIKELDALKPYFPEIESLGVNILAISQDKAKAKESVRSFVSGKKWPYKVVLDPDNKLRKLYNVQVMPTLFIVNEKKEIIYTHQGYKPGDEKKLMEKIRSLKKAP